MVDHRSDIEKDRALLRRLQSSDDPEAAFRELHQAYARRVFSFFSKRGFDTETCRELSQDTFFRVFRSRETFRGDVPLASWIFQIAANLLKNELRRRGSRKRSGLEKSLDDEETSDPIEVHTGGEPSPGLSSALPLRNALAREKVEAVREALESLPPRMRRTLQMWIHHEYSVAEIADVLKITQSTVKVQLHQGRKRLRKFLEERFEERGAE